MSITAQQITTRDCFLQQLMELKNAYFRYKVDIDDDANIADIQEVCNEEEYAEIPESMFFVSPGSPGCLKVSAWL